MISIKQIKTNATEYSFVENLLETAFPPEEHRELNKQRNFTDNNEFFYNNVILDNEMPVGLITYWKFDGFYYIEHFAISPECRNGGYGKKVLELLHEQLSSPVVLEVELPETEISKRRINFYERLGYQLIQEEYFQPPYRKQDCKLPMYLMIYDKNKKFKDIPAIKKNLYKHVYQVAE